MLDKLPELPLDEIADERVREGFMRLLNLVEELASENRQLRADNLRLRDELNRLKGGPGNPYLAGKVGAARAPDDHASTAERREPRAHRKGGKRDAIQIDRTETLTLERSQLPTDAEFKGYEAVVVQDLEIKTDNVLFRKEKYYAPATQQTYLAPLPAGYGGQFGPGFKALSILLYFACNVSQAKQVEFFAHFGLQVSEGQVSNLLIKEQTAFHDEKATVLHAGLRATPWHHLDTTGLRVNGQAQHTHVLGSPLYTAYVTTRSKDRLAVIEALCNGTPPRFLLDETAQRYLVGVGASATLRQQVAQVPQGVVWARADFEALLAAQLPALGVQQRRWLLDAAAVAAYQRQVDWPVVELLLCDDAPQFKSVTHDLALCWVHEGRHYHKLTPVVSAHRVLLSDFRQRFWTYYHQLRAYQQAPSAAQVAELEAAFDELFTTQSGYRALDARIALTRAKKHELLRVLDHPELPLHNNPAELAARQVVRKQDVSFGTRTAQGTRAWDTFLSLAATTKKLGLSFYHYIHDRLLDKHDIPPLAEVITDRAAHLQLADSWLPP